MRFSHTMVRVTDLDKALDFYCNKLGLVEVRRKEWTEGRYTVVFVCDRDQADSANGRTPTSLELVHFWDPVGEGGALVHICYEVDDIYATCQQLLDAGLTLILPPRDGRIAFVRGFDDMPIELIQTGAALPQHEPWLSMPNHGELPR